jgi:CRP-like cAMP-binding protein
MNALYKLSPSELSAVDALISRTFSVLSHQDILCEHEPAKQALVLLEGMASRYRIVEQARRQMSGLIVPGDFCDFAFLSASVTRQSVMAIGPALVGCIELPHLAATADKMPNIMVAAARGAISDQAYAAQLVTSLGARNSLQRMAYFFCELHCRLVGVGFVGSYGELQFPMSQAEIGEALGLSTVHVNRTIQQLRKGQLIKLVKGEVRILDLPTLAYVAGFDPGYLRHH